MASTYHLVDTLHGVLKRCVTYDQKKLALFTEGVYGYKCGVFILFNRECVHVELYQLGYKFDEYSIKNNIWEWHSILLYENIK